MVYKIAHALPWLRPTVEILRLVLFLGFVGLGLRLVWLQRAGRPSDRAVLALIIYAVVVSCAVGFTQVEAWPFTTWALVHNISQPRMLDWIVEGVDAKGIGYRLDPRFIEPLPYEDFDSWLKLGFMRIGLTDEEVRSWQSRPGKPPMRTGQRRVAELLISRANEARLRFLRGETPGRNARILGRFVAPYHFDRPPLWRSARDVPVTPFVGLRISQIEWDVEGRYRDPSRFERRLIFDYRP